jgi:PHP family Zn ribbon phosphoesterase
MMAKRSSKTGARTAGGRWACPECGRSFSKPNQAHSCKARSVDAHFEGRDPALRGIFDALRRALERQGSLRVDAVEASINLAVEAHFGGVTVRRDHLRLGFLADHEITSTRIVRRQRLGPNRVHHQLLLRSIDDVDSELMGWLDHARSLQPRGRGRG